MIKVKAIGKNARIVGGAVAMKDGLSVQNFFYESDLGSFYGSVLNFYTPDCEYLWTMRPDGTVPTKQDAIDAGINL